MTSSDPWTTWQLGEWRRFRRSRERGLAAPYGWLSLTALHWLDADPAPVPGFPGLWSGADGTITATFTAEDGVARHGEPITGTVIVEFTDDGSDDSFFHAGVVGEAGIRGGRPMLRLRDPKAPTRTSFTGVPTYDWDPAWVLPARFHPTDGEEIVTVASAQPQVRVPVRVSGKVTFVLGEEDLVLTVTGDGRGSVAFHDPTNGDATADWRFCPLGEIDPEGGTTLDFNRSLNFPSAFSPYGTCPRPLPENVVPIPVTAGERRPRSPRDDGATRPPLG